jgi:hypothetical protein
VELEVEILKAGPNDPHSGAGRSRDVWAPNIYILNQ